MPEAHDAQANFLTKDLATDGHVEVRGHYITFDSGGPVRLDVIDSSGDHTSVWLAAGEASQLAQALELAAQWSIMQERQDLNLFVPNEQGNLVPVGTSR